jgi:ankyrin repeat protein
VSQFVDIFILARLIFYFFLYVFQLLIRFGSYCMQAGAKVNVIAGGATPLHIAADNGSLELLNSLLKAGADPNVSDEVRHFIS